MNLSAKQVSTLLNALTVAANRYNENATTLRTAGMPRLGDQFDQQTADTRALIEAIETAYDSGDGVIVLGA